VRHTHAKVLYEADQGFTYMGLITSLQQFVERLNGLNCCLLYFPEESPKQLDQAKAAEWREATVNSNIEIFEMSYEESVSYFKRLENWRRSGPPTVQVLRHHQ
jgi:hypothetical protein